MSQNAGIPRNPPKRERKRAFAHASAASQSSISETDLTDNQHTVHNTSTENSSVEQLITATKYSMHSSIPVTRVR